MFHHHKTTNFASLNLLFGKQTTIMCKTSSELKKQIEELIEDHKEQNQVHYSDNHPPLFIIHPIPK